MKKTLLSFFLLTTLTAFSQEFGTGTITLRSGYTMELNISADTGMTTLTLSGPSTVWMAVGFGGQAMSDGADVFRTNGVTADDARATGRFMPANDAQQDWTMTSNSINGGTRTIVAERLNNTGDANDFVFSPSAGSISIIWALGSSTNTAQQHAGSNRGATVIGVTLGISEAKRLDFTMFPNPSEDEVNIQLPSGTDNAKVSLFDYTGRLILSKEVTAFDQKMNVANLSTGIYMIRVEADNKVGAQRLIKN